jgi:hypothetical protein
VLTRSATGVEHAAVQGAGISDRAERALRTTDIPRRCASIRIVETDHRVHISICATSVPVSVSHERRAVLSLFLVSKDVQVNVYMRRSDAFADLACAAYRSHRSQAAEQIEAGNRAGLMP